MDTFLLRNRKYFEGISRIEAIAADPMKEKKNSDVLPISLDDMNYKCQTVALNDIVKYFPQSPSSKTQATVGVYRPDITGKV